jgi:hypothetical protein
MRYQVAAVALRQPARVQRAFPAGTDRLPTNAIRREQSVSWDLPNPERRSSCWNVQFDVDELSFVREGFAIESFSSAESDSTGTPGAIDSV